MPCEAQSNRGTEWKKWRSNPSLQNFPAISSKSPQSSNKYTSFVSVSLYSVLFSQFQSFHEGTGNNGLNHAVIPKFLQVTCVINLHPQKEETQRRTPNAHLNQPQNTIPSWKIVAIKD